MTSRYRHRRTNTAATAFPSPVEPGELVINTANRQLVVGDADAAALGVPLSLLAVRIFDARAQYAVGDFVVQAGVLYRANAAVNPGAFNPAQWDAISAADVNKAYVDAADASLAASTQAGFDAQTTAMAAKVAKAGDTMTGPLVLPGNPTTNLQAATKQYVDSKPGGPIISDTPPAGAPDGALWWESDTGLLYVKYNDGNTTQWVIACPQPDINAFVQKSGDTMSGALTIRGTNPTLIQDAPTTAGVNLILGRKTGLTRWDLRVGDDNTETGGNSGSDFSLYRYDDAGNYIGGAVLYIKRATGLAVVAGDPTAPLGIATKQYVDNRFRRTRTVLNAVVSGTYTTPAGCNTLFIRMVGGGGGGGGGGTGAGNGSAGGPTTFGSLSAGPGQGGVAIATGAPGGAATGGDVVINGGFGGGSQSVVNGIGGHGGVSFFGGAAGSTATSNSGQSGNVPGGGGGGGSAGTNNWSGAGGGAGAYLEKLINAPAATYAYTVGYPGGGGTGGQYNGGSGASGLIIIDEYY